MNCLKEKTIQSLEIENAKEKESHRVSQLAVIYIQRGGQHTCYAAIVFGGCAMESKGGKNTARK